MPVNVPLEEMERLATEREEAGRTFRCLSSPAIVELASASGASPREVTVAALRGGLLPLRYAKNVGTLGLEGQAMLLESHAVVVGAGGLGGRASELLARYGVGGILVIDPDVFDETNLNRQGFCCDGSLGRPKAEVVRENLLDIDGFLEVTAVVERATASNLPDLLGGADVVVDGLDSLDDRLLLQEQCALAGVVLVHAAIAGTTLQATTIYPGEDGLRSIAPPSHGAGKSRGIEVEVGNPASTPAVAASIEVLEAVKVLTGTGETLRGRMLYVDVDDWTVEFIDL